MAKRSAARIDTTGKPWARYLRLSKSEAAEVKGKTKAEKLALTNAKLDLHLARITKWMDANDLPYDDEHVYRDPGLSAWKPEVRRPDWERMVEAAHTGAFAGFGVIAVDRYTRQVVAGEDLLALAQKVDVKIGGGRAGILDLTTYEGITMLRGMVQQAANESLATSFRLRETLADVTASGKPIGGGRAYGFDVVGDKEIIEVPQRPDEVAVVREMATRMLAGEPLQRLAADMNSRGLVTVRGGQWTGANLGRLLGQARYGGKVEINGKIVATMPGEPVLDQNTYESVGAVLASRRRGRRASGKFLLTGILMCADCRRTMNGAHAWPARADGSRPRVYRCPPQQHGCGRSILADDVESMVAEKMIGLLADPKTNEAIAAKDAIRNKERSAQERELAEIEEWKSFLVEKGNNGEISREAMQKSLDTWNGKRDVIVKAMEAPTVTPISTTSTPPSDSTLSAAAEDWHDEGMTDENRRALIRRYQVRPEILSRRPGSGRAFDQRRVVFA